MSPNFRDLEYFVTLAESGHMGRAAAHHGITQPALSKSLKRLESDVGLTLFDRSAGKLRLNASGTAFLDHARQLNARYHEAMHHASALKAGQAGVLRVGATGATLERIVTPALNWLMPRRPALQIRLTVGLSDELFDKVGEGKIDVAVAPVYGEHFPELDHHVLSRDSLCIVARNGHPLSGRPAVSLADTMAFPWIFPLAHSSARQVMQRHWAAQGLPEPRIAMEVPLITPGVLHIVGATDLISVAPEPMLAQGDFGSLTVLPVHVPLVRQLCLLTRREASWTPLMEAFREALR